MSEATHAEIVAARNFGREAAQSGEQAWRAIGDYCQFGYSDDEVYAFLDSFQTWRIVPKNEDDADFALLVNAHDKLARAEQVILTTPMKRLATFWGLKYRGRLGMPKQEVMAVVEEILAWSERTSLNSHQEER